MEKKNPVRKKGSGTIIGPTPSNKFIVAKAALFRGDPTFFKRLAMLIESLNLLLLLIYR